MSVLNWIIVASLLPRDGRGQFPCKFREARAGVETADPGSPVLVDAKINGLGPIRLILDTGAERTIISPSVQSRLGLSLENGPPITLKSVTGLGYASRVWVEVIEIGETGVGPLLVVVYAADLKGADGLLGRDFLSHLNVTIDSKEKVVTLTPN